MGCGCNKKRKQSISTDTSSVKVCDVSIKELDSLRLTVIKKGEFDEQKYILSNLDNLIENYYSKCPDKGEFDVLKNYIDNV